MSQQEGKKPLPIISITRKVIQLVSFFLINYAILEMIFNTDFDVLTEIFAVLPFLQTARSTWTAGAGFIEYMFASINNGIFPFFIVGLIGIFGLFGGRIFCGWVCPTGFISDLFSGLAGENRKFSINVDKTLKKLKTFILVLLLILFVPLGYYYVSDYENYFLYSDALGGLVENPIGRFSLSEFIFYTFPTAIKSIVDNMNLEGIFTKDDWVKGFLFMLYLILIGITVYYPRFYCRYLCPYAAAISVFSEYSFVRLERLPTRCPGRKECGVCENVCPMQIRVLEEPFDGFTGEGECILCLQCMQDCPHDAIKFKFGVNSDSKSK